MAERGPTQGAERHTAEITRWRSRPRTARMVRVAIFVAPLLASFGFTMWMGSTWPPERLGIGRWSWVVLVFAIANVLLYVVNRLVRRLLPLVALMKLTLVFPDSAPSRTKAALRRSNSRAMLRKMEESRQRGDLEGAALHGDYLVQLLQEINEHDRLTRGHSERVRAYSELLGEELGLDEADMDKLRWSALLHDVGKLSVPAAILNKDGRPSEDEWKQLQAHPAAAVPLLEPLRPWLGDWVHSADQHHCRWDGSGYPYTLSGNQISVAGRLVAIADAYDVMTSARSYKKPLSAELARQELTACAGSQFDPGMVRAFLRISLGQLRTVAGPFAWLANLTGSAQLPAPAVTAVSGGAWTTAVAAMSFVAVNVSGATVAETPEQLAFEEPAVAAAVVDVTTTTVPPAAVTAPTTTPTTTAPTTIAPTTTAAPTSTTTTTTVAPTTTIVPTTTVAPTTTTTIPVNLAPTAVDDAVTVNEDGTVLVDVLLNDGDAEGDALAIIAVSSPSNGSASIENGHIRYVPAANVNGTDAVTYTISDGVNAAVSAEVAFTITARNDAPEATSPATAPVAESAVVGDAVFVVAASDIDGDALSYTITSGNSPIRFSITPAGEVQVAGPLDHEADAIHVLEVTVDDGDERRTTVTTVQVADVDEPPVANDDADSTQEDTTVALDLVGNDSDPEGQTLIADLPTTSAAGGTVGRVGSVILYTPPADWSGTDSFTYTARDPGGASSGAATVTIVVSPQNDPPVAAGDSIAAHHGLTATPADVRANDSDVDGDALTIVAVSSPTNGTVFLNGDGTVTYTHDGSQTQSDTFTYTINDPDGAADTATVVVAIEPPEDGDAVGFALDVCDYVFDPDQRDTDGDGLGDACDPTPTVASAAALTDSGQTLDGASLTFAMALGDIDGDGDLDIVFGNNGVNTVFTNDGLGTFSDSGQSLGTSQTDATALADLDGDGDLDLVTAEKSADNTVWFNDGSGTFTNSGQSLGSVDSGAVAVGDVDGDGDLDVVYGNLSSENSLWLNDGDGLFTDSGLALGADKSLGVELGDVDSDGDLDIVFGHQNDPNTIWLNDGAGAFTDSGQMLGAENTHDVALVDVDGDGDLDLISADDADGDAVWRNNGSGVFTDTGQTIAAGHSHAVASGDLDGDGDWDLIFADHNGTNSMWLNDGSGTYSDSGISFGTLDGEQLKVGDVNGDGTLDVVFANDGMTNRVWLNS